MKQKILLTMFGLASSLTANATILTFSDMGLANYGEISQYYGDYVTSLSDEAGSYLQGNGYTPYVKVSYASYANDQLINPTLEYWDNNYGDLTDVAFSGVDNSYATITFTANAGYNVKLNSFDMAGWSNTDRALDSLQILDSSSNVLWSAAVNTISGANGTHNTFMPGIAAQELTIRWGADWNIGIDNINFDQQASEVPVPAAAWLFASAMAGLVSFRKLK